MFCLILPAPENCLQKGPYFKDLVLNKDLFGILGPYWVLIYISGSLFSLFWFHSRKECQFSLHVYNNELFWSVCDEQLPALLLYMYVVKLCFLFTLLANFHFYLCLRFNFHTSSFWVLIGSLFHKKMGPYPKGWGSLLVLEAVWMWRNKQNQFATDFISKKTVIPNL